jgi:signal transduction histidine kinase
VEAPTREGAASDAAAPTPVAGDPVIPEPGRFRRFAERHPVAMDLAVAGIYLLPALAMVTVYGTWAEFGEWVGPKPVLANSPAAATSWFFAAFTLVGCVLLVAWRRRHPVCLLAAVVVMDASGLVMTGVPDNWLVLFALFAVAQRASARAAWIGLTATCVELMLFGSLYGGGGAFDAELIMSVVLDAAVVSVFIHLGNRRRYVAALVELARHLALERDQRAVIAVAAERSRIAREMHDVVAHSVAVMVTLSDGAQAAIDRDPERARQAMAVVSETGRQTVTDMRGLLSVLHSEAGPTQELAPQPGADQLVPLIESFKASGLPVMAYLAASIPDHQALGLAIYRIVQESLTNVLRHAAGAQWVRVGITEPAPRVFQVVVENGPPGSDSLRNGDWEGSGQGLIGMRQRVGVFGGELSAGPTSEGGWRVEATLREGGSE